MAAGGSRRGTSKPLSVEQIVKEAENFEYNPAIHLKYWLRSAATLLREAHIYESEGNQQQTYLLLYRHAFLIIQHLPTHPDVKIPEQRAGLLQAEKEVEISLAKLDKLKPQINKKFERYEKLAKERAIRRAQEDAAGISRSSSSAGKADWRFHERPRRGSVDTPATQTLAAGENRELAVQLARKEIKRRSLARKATRVAGIPEDVEQERRTGGDWENWEEALKNDEKTKDYGSLSQQMQNVRLQVEGKSNGNAINDQADGRRSLAPRSIYNYPTIAPNKRGNTIPGPTKPIDTIHDLITRPPPPPPKDFGLEETAPARPAKQPVIEEEPSRPMSLDNEISPAGYTFKPSAYLENGKPLRTLFLPPDLRQRFLTIAESNTQNNLETCGILCGTLISNALFISRLVIPEQKSTSDTCEMLNESALFDYVDGEDLMVLGWIHTHPSQTCFMSSRDLHTHAGYQVMLPESIAIVCAPSKSPDWGVFRLTDPPGMPAILNCTKPGIFHPHDETNVYTDASKPGHVFEARGLEFELHDMRSQT